ncbi:MAG TPA: phosphatase PAP2 family protein [Candidatus Saccharimonadia bacterium]|nr:phosphatase PAP2 family protein [Candidatus Saccharimonadia bacterium]
MTKIEKFITAHAAAAAALLLAGLLGLDRIVAEYVLGSGYQSAWLFSAGTTFLDTITGKEISKFLVGLVLCGFALALLVPARTRAIGRSTLFVGLVQLLGTLLTGVSKNLFGRLRPFQLLESGDWSNAWFVDGSAFPSGHAGFYFGLFMPLAYLFPRWRWPLMLTPWFIAVARVNANDHFISDVAASIVMVAVLTLIIARLTKQRRSPDGRFEPVSLHGTA